MHDSLDVTVDIYLSLVAICHLLFTVKKKNALITMK